MRVGIRTCAYVVRLLFLRMGCSLCDLLCNSVEPYVRPARLDELSIETGLLFSRRATHLASKKLIILPSSSHTSYGERNRFHFSYDPAKLCTEKQY